MDWSRVIERPGSMAFNGFGEDIAMGTDWTGGIVDSSYFFKPSYVKYREAGNIKVPFWLQLVKYYKGKAWYQKEVVMSLAMKGDIKCWDEFSPLLYDLKLSVKDAESSETDVYTEHFPAYSGIRPGRWDKHRTR